MGFGWPMFSDNTDEAVCVLVAQIPKNSTAVIESDQ